MFHGTPIPITEFLPFPPSFGHKKAGKSLKKGGLGLYYEFGPLCKEAMGRGKMKR